MNAPQQNATPVLRPHPVTSVDDARQLMAHLADVMDALLGLVEQETALVRGGKLAEVAKLEPTKADLARLYYADSARLKASTKFLSQALPDALDALRRRHDTFHALLQINLTVLATAQAVSEGIMRGVSAELARKSSPQVYGSSGQTVAPTRREASMPLTISRTL
jgi:hypothetical protein